MGDLAPLKSIPLNEAPGAVGHPHAGRPVKISLAEARKLAIEFNERINDGYRRRAQAEAEEEARWEEEG